METNRQSLPNSSTFWICGVIRKERIIKRGALGQGKPRVATITYDVTFARGFQQSELLIFCTTPPHHTNNPDTLTSSSSSLADVF